MNQHDSFSPATHGPPAESKALEAEILQHLRLTIGREPVDASRADWRFAVARVLRDRIVGPWLAAQGRAAGGKQVYYLSMEFLIGRLLEDAAVNLGLDEALEIALGRLGQSLEALTGDEADPGLGNGGLGRLAACYLESMATLGCPGMGHGLRFEHGLFRQKFVDGRQEEAPEDWLNRLNPWEIERVDGQLVVGFGGQVTETKGRVVWTPGETILAVPHDLPVIGWQGRGAVTLRLWSARAMTPFDLFRFNAGEHLGATEAEAAARRLTRVLYPDDSTEAGRDLRLRQEYLLVAAAMQDILRQVRAEGTDLRRLSQRAAIQLNDTHPAMAGPELIRLLGDVHGLEFDEAAGIAERVFCYTNHTLLPEALERWPTWHVGNLLPRHMQIIERIDAAHRRRHPTRPAHVGIVRNDHVQMGDLSFILSGRVNGVSALHSDLVKSVLFPDLDRLHPGRIVNVTNGVTPRRWLRKANPGLARLITEAIGPGWEADSDRLQELEPFAEDAGFRASFARVKHESKTRAADWLETANGVAVDPAAMFDVQIKRIHEYKRQLLNLLDATALWQELRADPGAARAPRVKIFAGKAAPSYRAAKDIIRLINDAAAVINADPLTSDRLRIVFAPNYNVSMAELLIPAADLSEQISTAGMEASGTGNMKFALNGALTIGTLDGANVEIRDRVGHENFFLFGMTADEVFARRATPDHARAAILADQQLREVLMLISEGRFSPGEPARYHGLVDQLWNSDHFLVASDFASYRAAQAEVDRLYARPDAWARSAILNVARMGFFSSDRAIRAYMKEIWSVTPAPNTDQATDG